MNIYYFIYMGLLAIALPPSIVNGLPQLIGLGGSFYIVFFLILILLLLQAVSIRGNLKYATLIPLLIAIFYYYSASSHGNSENIKVRETITILLTMAGVVLFASIINFYDYQNFFVDKFIDILKYSAIFTGVVGLLQYIHVIGEIESYPGVGMMGHKNHYGYICALGFLVTVADFGRKSKTIDTAALIILFVSVMMSMCRGAWVLSVVYILIFLALKRDFSSIGALLFVGIVVYGLMQIFPEFGDRLNQADVSSGRYDLWELLLPDTTREILWGRGAGFMWSLTQYDINEFGGYVGDHNDYIYAHNDFIFLLVEVGVFLSVAWVIFCLIFFGGYLFKILNTSDSVKKYVYIGFCVSLSLIVSESVDTVFFGARNIYVYLALMILCFKRNPV